MLLHARLEVPASVASLQVTSEMLAQDLIAFESSAVDRGTLTLLSERQLTLQQGDTSYVLLPIEVSRVVGDSGIYLLLLEWQDGSWQQRDSAYIGPELVVRALELSNAEIQLTAIDKVLGRLPAIERTPRGGIFRFNIVNSQLELLD